jgi:hypothetical protein
MPCFDVFKEIELEKAYVEKYKQIFQVHPKWGILTVVELLSFCLQGPGSSMAHFG